MNKVVKRTCAIIHLDGAFQVRQSFIHSSPILERRRRSNWEPANNRFNNYYNRNSRKLTIKRELLQNVSSFAEDVFQNWRNYHQEYYPSSSSTHPWFRQDFGGKPRSGGPNPGSGSFYGSFTSEEAERENTSSYNNTRSQGNRRHHFDDEYNSSYESNCSAAHLTTSYRLALGLKSSGPLNLEDVKNAYRACALKWHPDRHQGFSKGVAEEKFKLCSTAYQYLCDQLTVN